MSKAPVLTFTLEVVKVLLKICEASKMKKKQTQHF